LCRGAHARRSFQGLAEERLDNLLTGATRRTRHPIDGDGFAPASWV
jgi:hypothetical protein